MATLQERLTGLMNAIFATTGRTTDLNTSANNLVGAINEVKVTADAAAGGGVSINDTVTDTTATWSSSKIAGDIASAQAAAIAAASTETTNQIATALEGEDLSDLADAVAANAAADLNLATAASVATLSATVDLKANLSVVYTRAELGDPDTNLAAYWNGL